MRLRLLVAVCILLLAGAVTLPRLDNDSLWYDEAWSVYAQAAPPPTTYDPPRGIRARLTTPLRAAQTDLYTTLSRVRNDVHPPLYFVTLDAWVWLAGDSVLALRYLSLLVGWLGVALMLPLGRRLLDDRAGLFAMLLLATSLFWVYYAREARMYSALITLSAAVTLAYVRFAAYPTIWRGLLYAILMALATYTHYTAALLPLAHGVHMLATGRWRLMWRWAAVIITAVGLYAPWLPALVAQFTSNPHGPLTTPEPTTWATIRTLTGYFVARGGVAYAGLLVLVTWAALRWPGRWRSVGLLWAWLLIVPGAVLAANALVMPLYNPCYTLAALPALALLAGGGLSALARWRAGGWVALGLALALAGDGLSAHGGNWGAKPPYREVIGAAAAARDPLSPVLAWVVDYDPFAYHGERAGLIGANTVNMAYRTWGVDQINDLVARFDRSSHVWVMMPTNHPETWFVMAALRQQDRRITYHDGVQNWIIYRLSQPQPSATQPGSPFTVGFGTSDGDTLAIFDAAPGGYRAARAGERLCAVPPITTVTDADMRTGLVLAQGYNTVIDEWAGPVGASGCVILPDDALGDYYLYVTLRPADGPPYPVWQNGVWWGGWVVWQRVSVGPQGR